MATVPTVRIECDGCRTRRQGKPGQAVDQLRTSLAGVGWRSVAASNLDLCPMCITRGRGINGGASA